MTRAVDPERVERRQEFARLLTGEQRHRVLELGAGPGVDAAELHRAGLQVTAVDLSVTAAGLCRSAGVDAAVASVLALPFADGAFDAGWTMSTLLHVPDADVHRALEEVARVLRPGAPLAVGLWAGADVEGPRPDDDFDPPRFFSLRSDARVRQVLGRHGRVERFDTWSPAGSPDATYQWCLLRLP
nr:class I SAM-dependent methyltransferase [Modestobacter versicolor]